MKINSKTKYTVPYDDCDAYHITERVQVLTLDYIMKHRNNGDVSVVIGKDNNIMLKQGNRIFEFCSTNRYKTFEGKPGKIVRIDDIDDLFPLMVSTQDERDMTWMHPIFIKKDKNED